MHIILLFIAGMALYFILSALWVVVSVLPVPLAVLYGLPLLLCAGAAGLLFRLAR